MIAESLHPAIEAAWRAIDEMADPESEIGIKSKGLLYGYHHRWNDSGWLCEEVERPFSLPIINPDTGKPSRTFTQAGKQDKRAVYDGKPYLVEHKTASEDLSDPAAPYFRRLEVDHQINQYMLAAWQSGEKLEGVLYDVIRKPCIRQTKKETLLEYGARLCKDTVERPDFYFARRVLYRLDSQILEFSRELWDTADEIRLVRLHDRHYKNPNACIAYSTPCEYLPLCSGHDDVDSGRWERRADVHAELEHVQDGRSVLTNSRIQCFRTCRRKHYLRYELGIKRINLEESEALFFGSVFHHALAAWWSCFPATRSLSREHCINSADIATAEPSATAANVPG